MFRIAPIDVFKAACTVGACAVFACAVGCGEDRGPLVVASEDPTVKIPAIQQAVRQRDMKDAAQLVKDLNSDDSAVRFYSIEGLRRLTGNDFGYRYYDDDDGRKPALDRWKQWLKDSKDGGNSAVATQSTEAK